MTKSEWPAPVRNLEELKALAEELANEFHDEKGNRRGEWFWNSYSCIMAPVPKGHIMDESVIYRDDGSIEDMCEDEGGYAVPIVIAQPPSPKCPGGDELHHPVPRKVAKFIEVLSPAFVLALIEGTANKAFDEEILKENNLLRRLVDQRTSLMGEYKNRCRKHGLLEEGER